MKVLKTLLKILGIILLAIIAISAIAYAIYHEPRPKGISGSEADQLARDMIASVNGLAWDTTGVIEWTFPAGRQLLWDKKRHYTQVSWNQYRVLVNINQKTGLAYKNEQVITNTEKNNQLVQQAWKIWVNDAFWLNPITKAFDPGTERSIVTQKDGSKALLITYTSGGDTPGDAYLWILDENNRPKTWKFWVSIIPIGGLTFSWDGWQNLPTGAQISTIHKSALFTLELTDIKSAATLSTLYPEDPFQALE